MHSLLRFRELLVSDTPLAVPHSTTWETSLADFVIPRDMMVFVNHWATIMIAGEIIFSVSGQSGSWTRQGRLHLWCVMPLSSGQRSCPEERFAKKQFSCTLLDFCTGFNLRVHLVPYCLIRMTVIPETVLSLQDL